MIGLQRTKSRASERGVALIIALLTLLLITAALMAMIIASNTETNISANFRDEQTAFFASKAGVEEIRDRLRPNAANSLATSIFFTTSPTPLPGAPNGVLYVTNPANGEVVAPWLTTGTNYPDDEICKEVTCTGGVPSGSWYVPAQSASASYAAAPILAWKWVRVMVKPNKSDTGLTRITSVDGATNGNRVCYNGSNEHVSAATCPDKQVYELTALAVTSSGSRRMIQYEVGQSTFPPLPGAIVFDGPIPIFSPNPVSAAFGVTGTDSAQGPNAGAGCPAANNVPGLGGYNGAAATSLGTQVNRPGSYTGSPAGIADVSTKLGPLSTVDGLTNLVNSVTAAAGANVYPSNPSGLNMGTNAAPMVNVVQGDLSLGGSGTGILVVEGNLTLVGGFSYNGLILVIGKGTVTKNGGGGGTLNGSLLVANLNDASGNPIALGYGNAPGIPTIGWNGGGNATFQYDSCWINFVSQAFPYKTIADRELLY